MSNPVSYTHLDVYKRQALDIVDVTGKTIMKQEGQVKNLKTSYALDKDAAGTGNYFLRVVRPAKNQVFNEKVYINR